MLVYLFFITFFITEISLAPTPPPVDQSKIKDGPSLEAEINMKGMFNIPSKPIIMEYEVCRMLFNKRFYCPKFRSSPLDLTKYAYSNFLVNGAYTLDGEVIDDKEEKVLGNIKSTFSVALKGNPEGDMFAFVKNLLPLGSGDQMQSQDHSTAVEAKLQMDGMQKIPIKPVRFKFKVCKKVFGYQLEPACKRFEIGPIDLKKFAYPNLLVNGEYKVYDQIIDASDNSVLGVVDGSISLNLGKQKGNKGN